MSDLQTVLLDCEYFPCIAWYQKFMNAERVLIEKHEYFKRATLRNRCYVAGSNGQLALSVPLEGGRNQKVLINNLRISYREKWQAQHWRTIQACYGRSAYYPYYEEELSRLFTKKYEYLFDLNVDTIQTINKLLQIKHKEELTVEYRKEYPLGIKDFRNIFTVKNHDTEGDVQYIQPFDAKNGFISGLSMLDLLMCEGKHSVNLIMKA